MFLLKSLGTTGILLFSFFSSSSSSSAISSAGMGFGGILVESNPRNLESSFSSGRPRRPDLHVFHTRPTTPNSARTRGKLLLPDIKRHVCVCVCV
uniref:Putative secreted protein n=1 Tax=Anopheles marajoara TaxID=58244 RepID=A0A2M4C9A6_9DIPT